MIPPPSMQHQWFGFELASELRPVARKRGLKISHETGVFRPGTGDRDYRVPDFVIWKPEQFSKRGVEGRCELIIEMLSPDDESRDKLPFYAEMEIPEVWLVDPQSKQIELYVLRGRAYHVVAADEQGSVRSPLLGTTLRTVTGPYLAVITDEGTVEI